VISDRQKSNTANEQISENSNYIRICHGRYSGRIAKIGSLSTRKYHTVTIIRMPGETSIGRTTLSRQYMNLYQADNLNLIVEEKKAIEDFEMSFKGMFTCIYKYIYRHRYIYIYLYIYIYI
jgi:hypothetical protein